jgi:DNA-binding NarL/FixJ family response regulator
VTIRVILADDQPLIRAGLRMLIAETPGIDVAGEAGTGPRRYSWPGTPAPTWS